jgi:isopentenyldiphosphate isomerase
VAEDELLDVFDDNMKLVGTASREEVHAKGLWHQTFHCWIVRSANDGQFVLFQRRGPTKKVFPNTLDITAAGHLQSGETVADGIREVNEELGLSVRYEDSIPLGIKFDVARIGSVINREFCHTFLLRLDMPLGQYRLEPGEVTGLVQIRIEDGLRLFAGEVPSVTATGYQVDNDGTRRAIEIAVSVPDIIPRVDPYYKKIFIMAERLLAGNRYLSI